jgi:hypothetical protein
MGPLARRIHVDTESFPIVVVTFHDGWSEHDLMWMFGEFERILRDDKRYAVIIDTTRAHNAPSVRERKLITDWENVITGAIERCNVGTAVVFKSALIRGSLTALSWLVCRKRPLVYVPTYREAGIFCMERLREAQLSLSEQARTHLTMRGIELT